MFLSRGAVPARVMIVVTSLMTINTVNGKVEKKLPNTSYVKVTLT